MAFSFESVFMNCVLRGPKVTLSGFIVLHRKRVQEGVMHHIEQTLPPILAVSVRSDNCSTIKGDI